MNKIILAAIVPLMFLMLSLSAQDGYPVPPKTDKTLFYIQRNHNKNTIMYDANFDEDGNLNKKKPVKVYWIRYEEKGQKMKLRRLERWMVYGVKCRKTKKEGYDFKVNLAASDKISLYLKQVAPFKAEIHIDIKGDIFELEHIYAKLSEGSWMPKPEYAELYGYDLTTGEPVYKKIDPKDIK